MRLPGITKKKHRWLVKIHVLDLRSSDCKYQSKSQDIQLFLSIIKTLTHQLREISLQKQDTFVIRLQSSTCLYNFGHYRYQNRQQSPFQTRGNGIVRRASTMGQFSDDEFGLCNWHVDRPKDTQHLRPPITSMPYQGN